VNEKYSLAWLDDNSTGKMRCQWTSVVISIAIIIRDLLVSEAMHFRYKHHKSVQHRASKPAGKFIQIVLAFTPQGMQVISDGESMALDKDLFQ